MRRPADKDMTDGGLRDYLFKVDPQITPPSVKRYIKDVVAEVPSQPAPRPIQKPTVVPAKAPPRAQQKRPAPPPVAPAVRQDDLDAVDQEIQSALAATSNAPVATKPASTPDSTAKINFLHTFFDRIEKTVRDLNVVDSDGRAAEAFRERAVRLVATLNEILPMDNIELGSLDIESAFPVIYKSPDSVKRVVIDWSQWIAGQQISSSSWSSSPGLRLDNASFANSQATVFVGGGELDQTYTITNRIVDDAGRIEERSVTISVKKT